MAGIGTSLVDLVLPRRCVGCGDAGVALCTRCYAGNAPFHVPVEDPAVVAAATYGTGLRRAIIAYKERGRRDLAGVLGSLLALAIGELIGGLTGELTGELSAGGAVLLVAPPSSRAAAAERGGDHVVRLARAAVRSRGIRGRGPPVAVASRVVRTTRRVRDSAGLSLVERERNLAGSMVASAPRAGRRTPVVIVDDIVTTGATLRETTRALRIAGWPVLGAAVVAATPRRLTADPLAGHGPPV